MASHRPVAQPSLMLLGHGTNTGDVNCGILPNDRDRDDKSARRCGNDPCRWMGRINRRVYVGAPTALVRDRIWESLSIQLPFSSQVQRSIPTTSNPVIPLVAYTIMIHWLQQTGWFCASVSDLLTEAQQTTEPQVRRCWPRVRGDDSAATAISASWASCWPRVRGDDSSYDR